MSGAVLVALAAAFGNLLQGWDTATIAGAVLYIKRELNLESKPTAEGLIVAMSLIGATLIATCSGGLSDWLGRRTMLIISSVFYFVSGIVMLWSPNVNILLLGRLLDGFGVGLAVTLVPVYISEIAPTEIRGLLNTLPQFAGSGGMFVSYCMVFGMSFMKSPSWRSMLGVLSLPSLIYFVLAIFFLPESPRWLVIKGRMLEAKRVLQRLHGREDVSGEMALLIEGLKVGGETTVEKYIIGPANEVTDDQDISADEDQIRLYGPKEGLTWAARLFRGGSTVSLVSVANQRRSSLFDPLVTLFSGIHDKLLDKGSMRSALFPHLGSMFSVGQPRDEEWDEESLAREGEEYYPSDGGGGGSDADENLQSPLISRQTTSLDKEIGQAPEGSLSTSRQGNQTQENAGEVAGSVGVGGGWQVAWTWTEQEGGFKRMYLHRQGVRGSRHGSSLSLPGGDGITDGEFVQAVALVSQPALYSKELLKEQLVGPAMVHPSETASKGPIWHELFEPGVKHALLVGVGIQILQQFSGINGVLYYTPQILEQAGVGDLLSHMGISSSSASLLFCALMTLVMLPCIAVAMRLMDLAGRRSLLLSTIPGLIASLLISIIGGIVPMSSEVHAAISTIGIALYFCFFVMGFGPIPNILCAEIFPTRLRGICVAICALAFWIGNIIVTYTFPLMLKSFGLAGVFGLYMFVCCISWVFVFLKIPETKGMPLEVIAEFFSLGAKQD